MKLATKKMYSISYNNLKDISLKEEFYKQKVQHLTSHIFFYRNV